MLPHPHLTAIAGTAALLCVLTVRVPSNPKTLESQSMFSQTTVPGPVAYSLRKACSNCHSNETVWPWYVHMPVVSLLLTQDVKHARENLNFSDWPSVQKQGAEHTAASFSGICENLLSGAMPKNRYIWLHPEAKLSNSEVAQICSWSNKQQMELLQHSAALPGSLPGSR